MSWVRTSSSPDVASLNNVERPESPCLGGVATNVKLLLKLIQDHNEASTKDNDNRNTQRVAGMVSILDDVKARVEKTQGIKKQLRRCNTDLKLNPTPREKKSQEQSGIEDNTKLRKDLNASMAAQKSLGRMFSSLGKEKEIMAAELARKAHELRDVEEHLNDLKAQNEMLLEKLHICTTEHKEKKNGYSGRGDDVGAGGFTGEAVLQERNKALTEQLLKSVDGYRSLKRKLKETQGEKAEIQAKMKEMAEEVAAGVGWIHNIRRRLAEKNGEPVEIDEEELSALEKIFRSVEKKDSKNRFKMYK